MTKEEYNEGVRAWADDVMRFALRLCGRRESSMTAGDAVQEAYAGLWRHREEVEVEKGKQYLLGAVHNQMMKEYRRLGRYGRAVDGETEGEDLRTAEGADERLSKWQAIEAALEGLTTTQRAILQLRDVEGYSYREVAETTGLNENQVQVYLFRARVAMRKRLKTLGYE